MSIFQQNATYMNIDALDRFSTGLYIHQLFYKDEELQSEIHILC